MSNDSQRAEDGALKKASVYSDELERLQLASAKSDLRWKRVKRTFLGGMTLWGTAFYFVMVGKGFDLWGDVDKKVAPVVKLVGEISAGSDTAGADVVIANLKKAFEESKAESVVLYIDTPGGSPSEAERISNYIAEQKHKTGKPIYAVCGNMCASAGYMIAIHTDEIHAGRYSLVGSIGAVLNSWNFSQAIEKFGLQHNAYASGKLKAMLSPYSPVKKEDQEKAQMLVNGMGLTFANDVRTSRAGKLTKTTDVFTGEIWDGNNAKGLGLIDDISTIDEVITEKFGDDVKVMELGKGKKKITFMDSILDSAAKAFVSHIIPTP